MFWGVTGFSLRPVLTLPGLPTPSQPSYVSLYHTRVSFSLQRPRGTVLLFLCAWPVAASPSFSSLCEGPSPITFQWCVLTSEALPNSLKLLPGGPKTWLILCPEQKPVSVGFQLSKWAKSSLLWALGCLPEKAMAPHSSTLAWKIPWTEEPGRPQSMGSRRVRHD